MINLLPEPKEIVEEEEYTKSFKRIFIDRRIVDAELIEIAELRFWNYKDIIISDTADDDCHINLNITENLDEIEAQNKELYSSQGYQIEITQDTLTLKFEKIEGYINGLTSIKQMLIQQGDGYVLPACRINDYPSLAVRAVAPTFSWYAGYGRIGFDSQLWGFDEWAEFINVCLDNKINQMNMVMYGYWPFEIEEYKGDSI